MNGASTGAVRNRSGPADRDSSTPSEDCLLFVEHPYAKVSVLWTEGQSGFWSWSCFVLRSLLPLSSY